MYIKRALRNGLRDLKLPINKYILPNSPKIVHSSLVFRSFSSPDSPNPNFDFQNGRMEIYSTGQQFRGFSLSVILIPSPFFGLSAYFLCKSIAKAVILKSIFWSIPTIFFGLIIKEVIEKENAFIQNISLLEDGKQVEITCGLFLKKKKILPINSFRKCDELMFKTFLAHADGAAELLFPLIIGEEIKLIIKEGKISDQNLFSMICSGQPVDQYLASDSTQYPPQDTHNGEEINSDKDVIDI